MSTNDKRDSWVSIHIRGGLEQGEISIKDTFLYECVVPWVILETRACT